LTSTSNLTDVYLENTEGEIIWNNFIPPTNEKTITIHLPIDSTTYIKNVSPSYFNYVYDVAL
jgi:hypothetical protein